MSILISLLIFLVIAGLVYWIFTLLPFPQPFKNIILVVVLLILLVAFLNRVGWVTF